MFFFFWSLLGRSISISTVRNFLLRYVLAVHAIAVTFWRHIFIVAWYVCVLPSASFVFCLQHFVCAKCEKPFLGHRHYERKGLAYCETHYNQVWNGQLYNRKVLWLLGLPVFQSSDLWFSFPVLTLVSLIFSYSEMFAITATVWLKGMVSQFLANIFFKFSIKIGGCYVKENVLTNRSEYGNEKNKIKMYLDEISFKPKLILNHLKYF